MTIEKPGGEDPKKFIGAGKIFGSEEEALTAYYDNKVSLFAKVKVRTSMTESGNPEIIETTVGRVMFNKLIVDSIENRSMVMS